MSQNEDQPKTADQTATREEISEWEEEHDEPHPIFEVPHRPERHQLELSDEGEPQREADTEQSENTSE